MPHSHSPPRYSNPDLTPPPTAAHQAQVPTRVVRSDMTVRARTLEMPTSASLAVPAEVSSTFELLMSLR